MTSADEWELEEYRQLSEDFRNFATQGWQIPLATLGVDALFVAAAATILSTQNPLPFSAAAKYFTSAVVLLGAVVLTVLVYRRMAKWQGRTKTTIQQLEGISSSGDTKAKLVRFKNKEPESLQAPLGEYMLVFMLGIGLALLVGAIVLFVLAALPG